MSKLPVGIEVVLSSAYGLSEMSYLELPAADIVKGETEATEVDSDAGNVHWTAPSSPRPTETLQCDGGYVITGMTVKTKSAESPYPGKVITGLRIRCTKLEKI
jgi:hypothetical protein